MPNFYSTRYITNIWSHPSHYPLNLPTLLLSLKGYGHELWIRIISSHVNRLFCSRDSVITNFDLENASCTCHALWKFRNDWTIKKVIGKRISHWNCLWSQNDSTCTQHCNNYMIKHDFRQLHKSLIAVNSAINIHRYKNLEIKYFLKNTFNYSFSVMLLLLKLCLSI